MAILSGIAALVLAGGKAEAQAQGARAPEARPTVRLDPAPPDAGSDAQGDAPAPAPGRPGRDAGDAAGAPLRPLARPTRPPARAADPGTVRAEPPGLAPATADATAPRPGSQGRLIPPAAPGGPGTGDAAPGTVPAPVVPLGPPAPDTLRESDFDSAACRLELTTLGAAYETLPPRHDPADRDCGIARPLRVTRILSGVAVPGGAEMRCDTARALAHWTRDVVIPAVRHLPGAPRLAGLEVGTSYECRPVRGAASASRLSEHATGNAVDIAGFLFDRGPPLAVAPRADRGDRTAAFQNAVQGAACLFFATVLGPGSNAAHDDHLHLDVKARRGGFRLCQ